MDPADNPESLDKDRPLREDIRLLKGRLLGDASRERERAPGCLISSRNVRTDGGAFSAATARQARAELQSTLSALQSLDATAFPGGPGIYLFFPAQQILPRGFAIVIPRHRARPIPAGSPPQEVRSLKAFRPASAAIAV